MLALGEPVRAPFEIEAPYPFTGEFHRQERLRRYELYTFKIANSDERQDEDGAGPAKIKDFERSIIHKWLLKQDGEWFACDEPPIPALPEEVSQPELYLEGAVREVKVNAYERSAQARAACIDHYKAVCYACEFDFGLVYGEVAEGLIHVHHIAPLSTIGAEYKLDPIKDLIPLCPNCHAVVHRGSEVMSIETLKEHLADAKRRYALAARPHGL